MRFYEISEFLLKQGTARTKESVHFLHVVGPLRFAQRVLEAHRLSPNLVFDKLTVVIKMGFHHIVTECRLAQLAVTAEKLVPKTLIIKIKNNHSAVVLLADGIFHRIETQA